MRGVKDDVERGDGVGDEGGGEMWREVMVIGDVMGREVMILEPLHTSTLGR